MRPSQALLIHRAGLRALVARLHLKQPRIFGSTVNGTGTEDSDLDLLVDPSDDTTLFTLARLKTGAEALMGVTVDVLTSDGLRETARDRVLFEA